MNITVQEQPSEKSCGQTVLAMALSVPVAEIIAFFGHDDTTYFDKDYKRVLKHYGKKFGEKVLVDNRKRNISLPNFCLVRINKKGTRRGHALLLYAGVFYDPWQGRTFHFSELKDYYPKHRLDRYMEILE
jgi:hypothetical protein